MIFEGHHKDLLSVTLRTGKCDSAAGVVSIVSPVVTRLQAARRKASAPAMIVRGDAGFATPKLYDFCEARKLQYCLGLPGNAVLQRKAQPLMDKVVAKYAKVGEPQRAYTSFWYRAKGWPRSRRVVVKGEVNAQGTNPRFVVTNRQGSAQSVYAFYAERGDAENGIKELKRGFLGDRLSCHRFAANAFRLLLHSLAYTLVHHWRQGTLQKTAYANAQISTLRMKLIKVAARGGHHGPPDLVPSADWLPVQGSLVRASPAPAVLGGPVNAVRLSLNGQGTVLRGPANLAGASTRFLTSIVGCLAPCETLKALLGPYRTLDCT